MSKRLYKIALMLGITVTVVSSLFLSQGKYGIGTTGTNKPQKTTIGTAGTSASVDSSATGKKIESSCLGGYTPVIPSSADLKTAFIQDAVSYSPITLNSKWYVGDHVGVKDTAYTGARHVVAQDGGIQFFGYDAPPYNDFMIMDLGKVPASMNAKQAPVRTDWHTINGGGMLFNVKLQSAPNKNAQDRELGPDSSATLEGYSFVMTTNTIEVRKYNYMSVSEFLAGSEDYSVLISVPKTCQSQSLTIEQKNNKYKFYVGLKQIGPELTIEPLGTYGGLMCDYASHGCDSLSSMYVFNFTVDGKDYLKKDDTLNKSKPTWKDGLKYVTDGKGNIKNPETTVKPSPTPKK